MDSTLVAVTLMAVAMALFMSVVTWRLIREERRRSAARVAALVAEMGAEEPTPTARKDDEPHRSIPEPRPARATADRPSRAIRPAPLNTTPEPAAHLDFRIGQTEEQRPSILTRQSGSVIFAAGEEAESAAAFQEDMFAAAQHPSGWKRRLAVVGAVGMILIGAARTVIISSRNVATSPAVAASGGSTQAPAPLELVSLRHARQNSALTITGLVRNPVGSAEVRRITAVVFVFDRTGAFLTSGRAPLDFTTLAPGDESPFIVSIPDTGSAGRYRVSFRSEDGSVMPHVDRRAVDSRQSTVDSRRSTTDSQGTGRQSTVPVGSRRASRFL